MQKYKCKPIYVTIWAEELNQGQYVSMLALLFTIIVLKQNQEI